MAVFEDRLEIRARMDDREYQRGAKRVNRSQQDLEKQAAEAARKAAQRGSATERALRDEERARKKLATLIERTEKKSATFGKRGIKRLEAQKRLELERARALGATERELERVARAYDKMGRSAEGANRKQRGGAGGGGAVSRGARAVGGGLLGLAATVSGVELLRNASRTAQRSEELAQAQVVVARNTNLAASALEAEVQELRGLDLATVDARESVIKLAASGGDLAFRADELATAGRDVSTVMGGSVAEAFERLTAAIVKEEVEILETAGLLVKFKTGYEETAAALGKNADALTEQEKLYSRFNQVLEAADSLSGAYEETLKSQAGQVRELKLQWSLLNEEVGAFIGPAVITGLKGVNSALENARAALDEISKRPVTSAFDATVGGALQIAETVGTGGKPFGLRRGARRILGTTEDVARGFLGVGTDVFKAPGLDPSLRPIVNESGVTTKFGGSVLEKFRPAGDGAGSGGGGRPPRTPRFDETQTAVVARLLTQGRITEREAAVLASGRRRGEIFARTAPGGPVVSATPGGPGGAVGDLFRRQEDDLAAQARDAGEALAGRLERERRMIQEHNERVFGDLKDQSGRLFDAMLAGGDQFWNFFRNAGLTAMRDIFSTQVAGLLGRGGFGGGAIPGLGGFGGLAGAPGGTSGFAGPVGGRSGSSTNLSGFFGGISGGASSKAGGFAGPAFLSNPLFGVGIGAALAGSRLPGGRTAKSSIIGGGISTSLLGVLATAGGLPGIGAAAVIGAGAGIGALIGSLTTGARKKVKQAVKATYGVDIVDEGVLGQVTELVKAFGDLQAGVRSPMVRELVLNYSLATAQNAAGLGPEIRTTRLVQRNGQLFQAPSFGPGGGAFLQESRLPTVNVNPARPVQVIVQGGGGNSAREAIARNPELTAHAQNRALASSQESREVRRLMLDPLTAR